MQILLIHGFRGNHLGLREVARFLRRDGFEVIVPDFPPAGKEALEKYDAEHYAKWVANYILEKKLERPVLVGHSMGSIIAAATAEKFPELINEKIVFLAPISVKTPRFIAPITPVSVILPNSVVSHITTKYLIVKKGRDFYRKTVALTKRCAEKQVSRIDTFRAALFAANNSISDFSFSRDAIFIAGENDRLNPKEATKKVAKKFHAKAVFVAGAGHLLNYEVPEIVMEKISDFLKPKMEEGRSN